MSTVNSEKQVTIEKNTIGDMAAAVIVAKGVKLRDKDVYCIK